MTSNLGLGRGWKHVQLGVIDLVVLNSIEGG